ncbi:MAG: DUF523 domain-containing protein [Alphaproteobacteria bacterium]|nr:DUF523 domain-containing protein [Alphaproteobacteria bacterium]
MYLVSACLVGCPCRYNATSCASEVVQRLVKEGKAVPVCPEQLASLPTPRESCEIVFDESGNKKVVGRSGTDLTEAYTQAATKTLAICKALGINQAILKSKSPSCGSGQIYDGTFSGQTVAGDGLTAEELKRNGVRVMTELEAESLILSL